MKLVAGNSNRPLAEAIGAYLKTSLSKCIVRRFADDEIFVEVEETVGFPFLLPRAALPIIEAQMAARRFSLQALAAALRARRIKLRPPQAAQLFNVNTPGDFVAARWRWEMNRRPGP